MANCLISSEKRRGNLGLTLLFAALETLPQISWGDLTQITGFNEDFWYKQNGFGQESVAFLKVCRLAHTSGAAQQKMQLAKGATLKQMSPCEGPNLTESSLSASQQQEIPP